MTAGMHTSAMAALGEHHKDSQESMAVLAGGQTELEGGEEVGSSSSNYGGMPGMPRWRHAASVAAGFKQAQRCALRGGAWQTQKPYGSRAPAGFKQAQR